MEEQKIYLKTSFSYTDESGETTTLTQTHDAELQEDGDVYFLMNRFKSFLTACGYSQKCVDRVQYIEDDEAVVKKEVI